VIVSAATAVAATFTAEFLLGRESAQFEGFINVLVNRLLDLMKFLLGIEEIARNGILQQGIAMLLKIGDFLAG